MSSFPSHFRRKYFNGKADFTRRQAYFTDLPCKSISLRAAHIPMRNPLKGVFLFWQRYNKLIQCTVLLWNAPSVFAFDPKDNRDRKDKIR